MALGLSDELIADIGGALIARLDGGSGPATFDVYTAPRPARGASPTGATLLGTLTFSDPSGTQSGNVVTFSALTPDSGADASGTAAWGRAKKSTGAFVLDASITVAGGGGDFVMNSVNVVAGLPIAAGTLTVTVSTAS